jgi:SAM-dependent methyltransferase
MGIYWHAAKALIDLDRAQGPLGRTATLGRQVFYTYRSQLASLLKGLAGGAEFIAALPKKGLPPSADTFFMLLGATEVVSFDNSEYEGASVVHDMNVPLPQQYRDSFDFVYDGGTLEHIFNFPQAIRNCMDLLKVGGTFVTSTPANNFMGHGFYQFSPELFFRLFCPENGFHLGRSLAYECEMGGAWYEMEDPKNLRRRVELLATGARIQLWIEARKVAAQLGELPLLPQQSDYAAQWESHATQLAGATPLHKSFRQTLRVYGEDYCPGLVDYFRRVRDKRRLRSCQRRGLRSDPRAYKQIA